MTDVHLFGYVRSRVVDGDGHRLNRGQAQFVISQRGFQLSGQPVRERKILIKPGPAISVFPQFRQDPAVQSLSQRAVGAAYPFFAAAITPLAR